MKLFHSLKYFSSGTIHNIKRSNYKILDQSDFDHFKTILKPSHIITDETQLQFYNKSWNKMEKGSSKLVLTPQNTQQISKILQYCNKNNIAVVPQGGNTGLVGGSVPVFDELIISTKQMNKIIKFDKQSSVLTIQAGVILDKANQYLSNFGCQIPLVLGSKGSCQLGGNASTNAGGIYLIKHGSFRSHILGIQTVLPNGTILNLQSQIHKDNTGYDIKHLFIGGEGTLGMITKLNIHCSFVDISRKIIVIKAINYHDVIKALPIIKSQFGKKLNALQYADGLAYQTVTKWVPGKFMQVGDSEHLLFIQVTADDNEIQEMVQKLPQLKDSIMSNNQKQFRQIWHIRQSIAYASVKQGRMYAYDVSFDVKQWDKIMNELRKKNPGILIIGYGHIGDGNIHINICVKQGQKIIMTEQQIFKQVVQKGGSISAEHGVGIYKPQYLSLQKSQSILQIYKQIKNIFDPNKIMNPYKVIP